jgi:hypothetical protein
LGLHPRVWLNAIFGVCRPWEKAVIDGQDYCVLGKVDDHSMLLSRRHDDGVRVYACAFDGAPRPIGEDLRSALEVLATRAE